MSASAGDEVRERGQSLVEFGLVIPILLVLFVVVADFGRIFATGIVLEAASRDAAEIASQSYLSKPPANDLSVPAGTDPAYDYDAIHVTAARRACAESRALPRADYQPDGTCATWPVIRVCVHDGADPSCGASVPGFASTVPAGCGAMTDMTNSTGGTTERFVEVRVCYEFTALLNMPLFSLGDFTLRRDRMFSIPCYYRLVDRSCG